MDVSEAIKTRRSVRHFKPDPVPAAALAGLLEAARWAPSWANTQCWRFVIIRDAATKNRLAEMFAYNRASQALREAPVVIVTCAEIGRSGYIGGERIGEEDWYMFDCALALQNLALSARAAGLGTVQMGNFDAAQVADLLNVPDGFRVVIMTLLGYPDETPAPSTRRNLSEIVYLGRFGQTYGAGLELRQDSGDIE